MDRIFAICRVMRWGAGIIAMSVGCVDAAIAQEASSAWSLSAEYTADLAGVASGGIERGVRYLDNIDVIAEADLDALIGWHGGKAHAALLNNMGVNRRPKRTPYRRAKGTPFVEQRDGYDGRTVRAGCGVGRA